MKKILALLVISISLFSCTLKYGEDIANESVLPEFIFENSTFTRYEDNVKTINLNAERLEQYKSGKSMYAKNVLFNIFDTDGNMETSGKCGLMGADTKTEKYLLFENIEINQKKDDISISAQALKWDGKTEQLTSGLNDVVSITKEGTQIRGSGFSASGVSRNFVFTGYVSGSIDTNEDESTESSQTDEEISDE